MRLWTLRCFFISARGLSALGLSALGVSLLCVACASPTQTTTEPAPTTGDDEPIADDVAPEDLPTDAEPLRAEDAVGFAQMDPSREEDECMPEESIETPSQAWRISETRTLVWLPCERGAYQTTGALFLVGDDGETERLALPYVHREGDTLSEIHTGEWSYDQSTRIGTDFRRYRGLGDCGRRLRFEVGQVGLTLVEHRERACSGDEEGGGPDSWPVIYPAPDSPE